MAENQEPQWKDISFLPFIGNLIDQGVKDNEEHYHTLLEAKPKPHVLDDHSIGRVFKVYHEQRDFLWVYEEQIARWKKLNLPKKTLKELNRLEKQLEKDKEIVNKILSLAEELKKGTIDTILAKDDMDLGFEILEGKRDVTGANLQNGSGKSAQQSSEPATLFSAEQLQIVTMIDQKVKILLKADKEDLEIFREMHEFMPGFKRIVDTTTSEEINELGRQHFGFYHFAQILEDLASGIQSGEIKVPK
ncbi:MAG: hypothetical protein ACHQYP_09945 [Nitrospiria bacterium]